MLLVFGKRWIIKSTAQEPHRPHIMKNSHSWFWKSKFLASTPGFIKRQIWVWILVLLLSAWGTYFYLFVSQFFIHENESHINSWLLGGLTWGYICKHKISTQEMFIPCQLAHPYLHWGFSSSIHDLKRPLGYRLFAHYPLAKKKNSYIET